MDAYAVNTADQNIRRNAASGGFVTSLLIFLLESGHIDGAIITKRNRGEIYGTPFIATSRAEIIEAATSVYAPVKFDEVLQQLLREKTDPRRYAVVGLPCHIEGITGLQKQNPALRDKIVLKISLVCGQTTTVRGYEYSFKKLGINKTQLISLKNRGNGWPGEMRVVTAYKTVTYPYSGRYSMGTVFSSPLFTPPGCHRCVDGVGYNADLSVSDAWLPRYLDDRVGKNLVLVKSSRAMAILLAAFEAQVFDHEQVLVGDFIRANRGVINKAVRGTYLTSRRAVAHRNIVLPDTIGLPRRLVLLVYKLNMLLLSVAPSLLYFKFVNCLKSLFIDDRLDDRTYRKLVECNTPEHLAKIEDLMLICLAKLEKDNYSGYDPADILNSEYRFISKMSGPAAKVLSLINIYSPINMRRILKIKPAQNTTAMVKLAQTYLNIYRLDPQEIYINRINFFVNWLLKRAIQEDGTLGLNRTIEYQYSTKVKHDYLSSLTFINAQMLQLLLDLYDVTGQQSHLDHAVQFADHITDKTNRIENFGGICLSYISKGTIEVFNASILAGRALNRIYSYVPRKEYLDLSEQILEYTLNIQCEDGSWPFSYKNGKFKMEQIDFHQVYMLEGISYQNTRHEARVRQAFAKGYGFYIDRMFDKRGRPLWRWPRRWPIDVHNISHAIYFLSMHRPPAEANANVEGLLDYLLEEFYDAKGDYFYYHKYPFGKNKIHYFRWNTVWTLYALSEYLKNTKRMLR